MEDKLLSWIQSVAQDAFLPAMGIWLMTEAVSQWNRLDSKLVSVLLTPVFGFLAWWSGNWKEHTPLEAVVVCWVAWEMASIFHKRLGKTLSEGTIGSTADLIKKLVAGNGNGGAVEQPPQQKQQE